MDSLIQKDTMEEDPHEPTEAVRPATSSQTPASGSPSAGPIPDDDLFEPVSLGDPDRPDRDPSGPDHVPSADSFRSSGADASSDSSSAAAAAELDDSVSANTHSSPPYSPSGLALKPSPSSGSFDSYPSPVASPPKPRAKQAMPDVPPELVHLVDSAIMGKAESIKKLQSMVSDGGSCNFTDVSRSVVDALLATMGGVEGLDEIGGGALTNPPSVMMSLRAAVVAAGW